MATQEKTWNVANRLHSQKDSDNPEVNHIIAGADEIYDDAKGAKQSDINAQVDAALGDRYTKTETYSKEQLDSLITTPDVNYVSVVATDATTAATDILPATGEANTIYRVGNWNGTQYDPTMYALYAWNGSAYVCLAVRSFVGEVYDISVNHPDGQGNPTPYADLTAALGTNGANIPADIRRGGMIIKFIQGNAQSSDNKYVQYFLTKNTWSIDINDWISVGSGSGSGDGAFDISAAHSGATYDNLAAALGTNGANVQANKRKGGMSVKFIQNIYATYSVVKTEGLDTEPTGTELQSASAVVDGVYTAAQLSDFNTAATLPATVGNSVTYYFAVNTTETVEGEEVTTTTYTKWVVTKVTDDSSEYVQWRYRGTSVADADFVKVKSWQGVDDEPTYESENLAKSSSVYEINSDIHGGVNLRIKKSYIASNGTSLGVSDGIPIDGLPKGTVVRWYINKASSLSNAYISFYLNNTRIESPLSLSVNDSSSYYEYECPITITSFNAIRILNGPNGSTVGGTFTLEVLRKHIVVLKEEYEPINSVKIKNLSNPNKNPNNTNSATGDGSSRMVMKGSMLINTLTDYNVTIFAKIRVRCSKACTIYTQFANQDIRYFCWREQKTASYVENGRLKEFARPTEIPANTYVDIYSIVKPGTLASTGAERTLYVAAIFDTAEDADGAELTWGNAVTLNLSNTFGIGNEPDKNTIYDYLKGFEDCTFAGEVEFIKDKLYRINNHAQQSLENYSTNGYVRIGEYGNIELSSEKNTAWPGWSKPYWSYGQNSLCDPVPNMIHGKLHTDSLFSVCPTYGNWGPKAVTTNGDNWGGHVFHGWNSRMTYRLTMMASGGMTLVDGDKREDEFCIHVFSPANSVPSYPITENTPFVEKDEEDRFGNNAWYGRVRIGADTGTEGFVFRAKSLTCYGRVDINGNKFILGNQTNVPLSSASAGVKGEVSFDDDYLYIHNGTKWKRIALEDF